MAVEILCGYPCEFLIKCRCSVEQFEIGILSELGEDLVDRRWTHSLIHRHLHGLLVDYMDEDSRLHNTLLNYLEPSAAARLADRVHDALLVDLDPYWYYAGTLSAYRIEHLHHNDYLIYAIDLDDDEY